MCARRPSIDGQKEAKSTYWLRRHWPNGSLPTAKRSGPTPFYLPSAVTGPWSAVSSPPGAIT